MINSAQFGVADTEVVRKPRRSYVPALHEKLEHFTREARQRRQQAAVDVWPFTLLFAGGP